MLHELDVRDFRCFTRTRIALHPQTTVLVGRNAQGKTSLLEAACVLLRLQSPRTSQRAELIRFDAKNAMIEGRWSAHALRFGCSASVRRMAVDGAVCSRADEYLQHSGLVVWMDHADMNLVRGAAEHRRRFMDFAASQVEPGYLHALQGFNRALRSRNYVLKKDASVNWRQVDAYARLMDVFHATLRAQRADLMQRVQPHAQDMLDKLSGGHEALEVTYAPGCEGASLFDALVAARAEEERTRTTFTGAHRDDFAIRLNRRAAESYASEGQQRSISLALKLAQARVLEQAREEPPLLLIDDVFGELDPERRRALLEHLPHGSQRIITTTHLDWAGEAAREMAIFQVKQGEFTSQVEMASSAG